MKTAVRFVVAIGTLAAQAPNPTSSQSAPVEHRAADADLQGYGGVANRGVEMVVSGGPIGAIGNTQQQIPRQ